MDGFMGSVVAIAGLLTGAAVVATLVSKNAQTGSVISSGFGGFSQALGVALSPVTGGSFGTPSPSYQTF